MAREVQGHFERVRALAVTPDGQRLVLVGDRAGTASAVWSLGLDGRSARSAALPSHGRAVVAAGHLAVVGASDGALYGFDLARDLLEVLRLEGHPGGTTSLAAFPDGDRIASAGVDGVARVWSLGRAVALSAWPLSEAPLRAVAVDATGEYLAAAGDDGVVRVVTLATGAVRVMPGHEGAVLALTFTPRDGRLASAGDDALIRLWYLAGAVECEVRGQDDSGHKGPVLSLAVISVAGDGADGGDRLCAGDATGAVKVWRLEDRRKARTLDAGPGAVTALALVGRNGQGVAAGALGALVTGTDARRVSRFAVDATGAVADKRATTPDGFELLAAALRGPSAGRGAVFEALAALDEPEAAQMLGEHLGRESDATLRTTLLGVLARAGRRATRAAVRARLDDSMAAVRTAALAALRTLEGDDSLDPLRAALASRFADMRVAALGALVGFGARSPLVVGWVTAALGDGEAAVRLAALDALTALHPAESVEPLRVAFERGVPALKLEVLVRAAERGLASHPVLGPVVARALDDDDSAVRRAAFAVRALHRRALLGSPAGRDEALTHAVTDIVRRAAMRARPAGAAASAVSAAEEAATLRSLPGASAAGDALTADDLEPFLSALACTHADTALRGARGLSLLGDARALGALLQITREADPALRQEGARALRALDDARARRRLVAMLDDAEASVRAAALDAYAACAGVTPLAVAHAALRSTHEDLRVRAMESLVALGPKGDDAAAREALLGEALEDEAARVRAEAFRTLLLWHGADAAPALRRSLAARFADVRVRAVDELSRHAAGHWAMALLRAAMGDRDAGVAAAAYEAVLRSVGAADAEAHRAALGSRHVVVRALAAYRCRGCAAEAVWETLRVHLDDEAGLVRCTALQSLDALGPSRVDHLLEGLASPAVDLQVTAAELGVARGLGALVEPMRRLLSDSGLGTRLGAAEAAALRTRAAGALAALGNPSLVGYFSATLLRDGAEPVRRVAARAMARASRTEHTPHLLDALAHDDAWVRAEAADGLARLGDLRALPVLLGNLRHNATALRAAALVSFAALGREGEAGLVQGLEDPDRALQELVLAVVLARDLRALARGDGPELLTSALSSQRAEVRVRAARALELRVDPAAYVAHLLEVLGPVRGDSRALPKGLPDEAVRTARLLGLAAALASDDASLRHTATTALLGRTDVAAYFVSLRDFEAHGVAPACAAPDADAARTLRRLAFGAYVGLLRQPAVDEDGQRARREAAERVAALGAHPDVGLVAAVAPLARALDDGHHLVRRAALAGLQALYPGDREAPLVLALTASSPDVARQALDQLAEGGEAALPRLRAAMEARHPEVRKHAFGLVERMAPRGSLDPLLAALASPYDDLRLGVIERLARTDDARVTEALGRALGSAHDDLRLRASELLAERSDARAVPVLAAFLADERGAFASRAEDALVALGQRGEAGAVEALAARLEAVEAPARAALLSALGRTRHAAATEALRARLDDADGGCRLAALEALLELAGRDPKTRDEARLLAAMGQAAAARDPALRQRAAQALADCGLPAADEVLLGLFHDRASAVREAAVGAYAERVKTRGSVATPLEAVLQGGQRALMLPSAEALAHRGVSMALRPLMLVARAGEPAERVVALLALGTLGDARALPELESLAAGTTAEQEVDPAMQDAAVEALGRLAPRLHDPEARARVIDRVEAATGPTSPTRLRVAGVKGLRAIGGERSRGMLESLAMDEGADGQVRAEAATALGALGDVRAEEALVLCLRDEYDVVHEAARKALDALFPHEATRVALRAVQSPVFAVAEPAAEFLAREGDPATLVARMGDLDAVELRERLRYGLLRRGAAPAAALTTLLEHPKPGAREEAARLLGAAGAGGVSAAESEALDAALGRCLAAASGRYAGAATAAKEPEARAWAWCLWAARGRAVPGLDALCIAALAEGSTPPAVRVAAARCLGAVTGDGAQAALAGALGDADPGVRSAAAEALEALVGARAGALAVEVKPVDAVSLGATARSPGAAALVAQAAGRRVVLASLVTQGRTTELAALATDAAAEVGDRVEAVGALGRIGGETAAEVLTGLAFAKAEPEALRRAAYAALRRGRRVDAARARREEAVAQ